MKKVNQFVIIHTKDAQFYIKNSVFERAFLGDSQVFINSTPMMQLRMSDICIRDNVIIKCRYNLDDVFNVFLDSLPVTDGYTLPYRDYQLELIYEPAYESHPWECKITTPTGTIHGDKTSYQSDTAAIATAKQTIDTMLGEKSEDIL